MDFWDLTKVLFRRWYFSIPLVLVTVGLTALTGATLKPNHVATGYVQLVPPASPTLRDPTGAVTGTKTPAGPRNPWLDLGLNPLTQAAVVTVEDKKVVKEFEARGLSENFTVTADSMSPQVTFEVVGKTEQQAKDTLNEVIARFDRSVADLQKAYGGPPADLVTTRRLDGGDNVEVSSSKIKRTLVAVLGAGLLFVAGTTVALDAMLRRRSRRRNADLRPAQAVPISQAGVPANRSATGQPKPSPLVHDDDKDVDSTMVFAAPNISPVKPIDNSTRPPITGLTAAQNGSELNGTSDETIPLVSFELRPKLPRSNPLQHGSDVARQRGQSARAADDGNGTRSAQMKAKAPPSNAAADEHSADATIILPKSSDGQRRRAKRDDDDTRRR